MGMRMRNGKVRCSRAFCLFEAKLRIALSQTFFRSLQETFFFSAKLFVNVRKAVRNRAASGVRKREKRLFFFYLVVVRG